MKRAALIIGLLSLPVIASAAVSQRVTVNLCNSYPYVVDNGVNLNEVFVGSIRCRLRIPTTVTVDLCKQNPRVYGIGDHDKNAFMQNTGQCK